MDYKSSTCKELTVEMLIWSSPLGLV